MESNEALNTVLNISEQGYGARDGSTPLDSILVFCFVFVHCIKGDH